MKKRYSIWVREIGSDHDVELMQCDGNPQALVDGLYGKQLTVKTDTSRKKMKISRYSWVRIVDNHAESQT